MNHLLDANTLIEAKNRYYGMASCRHVQANVVLAIVHAGTSPSTQNRVHQIRSATRACQQRG